MPGSEMAMTTVHLDYTRFADSPLWTMQRHYFQEQGTRAWAQTLVPEYVTSNPVMAQAYSRIVLGFWRDLKARYGKTGETLYIIDVGAGSGRFAYHFLTQFFDAFDTLREEDDKVVYVVTDFAASTVAEWQSDASGKLQPYVDQGRLDFAVFDAEADTHIHLQRSGTVLGPRSLALPPVVIANYVFDSLRQDLYFLDKGSIAEGWLALESSGQEVDARHPFAALRLHYRQQALETLPYDYDAWNALIEDYAKQLPPGALLFPSHALAALDRLRALHGTEMLLLSADRGTHEAQALSGQAAPGIARHGSMSFPVNYHAIGALVRAQGGQCWDNRHDTGLALLAACWTATPSGAAPGASPWRETALAARQALLQFSPNDFYRIRTLLTDQAGHLAPEEILAYLRLSQWDARVFYTFLPHVQGKLAPLRAAAQTAWAHALEQIWNRHLPIGEDYDLAFDLASLAAEMHRWQLAIDWFQASMAGNESGNTAFNLAISYWQLARHDDAADSLARAASSAPAASPSGFDIGATASRLKDWRMQCSTTLGAHRLHLAEAEARLAHRDDVFATLLGEHHAEAVYRFQRDPLLSDPAGVPCLEDVQDARQWIAREHRRGALPLAILHREFGLVGVAALECAPQSLAPGASQSARFYYWIGRDFHNRGFGTQALFLLRRFARHRGLRHLFTTVADDNKASQHVLAHIGCRRMPHGFSGGRPRQAFYHCGLADAEAPPDAQVLAQLLGELGSAERLLPSSMADRDADPA